MNRLLRLVSVLGVLQMLAACASAPAVDKPIEYLDEKTAATVTAVERPIVFARERRDLAANVRDYVTLAAAAVNRSGKVSYVLIAYFWSTVDTRGAPQLATADPLVLAVDDRRIQLTLGGTQAADQGIALPVHEPPHENAAPNVYRTDLATLRQVALGRSLTLRAGADDGSPVYQLWDDQRGALAAFVRFMNGEG